MQGIVERPGRTGFAAPSSRDARTEPSAIRRPGSGCEPLPRNASPRMLPQTRTGGYWRSDFSGEWLTGAHLAGEDLRESSFRKADLTQADLRGADLRRADLYGANLTGADLRGADLREARLTAVHFRGARCDEHTRWPAGFHPEQHPELAMAPAARKQSGAIHLAFAGVAGLALAVDQIVKAMVRESLPLGDTPRWLPGDVLFLQRVENHGLNLQLLEGVGPLLTVAMGLVLIGVLAAWVARSRRGPVATCTLVGMALIFGGGIGNALDRLVFGAVLDYIGVHGGMVINLADLAVVAGLVCLGMARPAHTARPKPEAFNVNCPAYPGTGVHHGR